MERKSRAQSESFVFIGIVAAALVLVNVLSVKYFVRHDMTARRLFTLSDGTKNVLSKLHDELQITVYFTGNQPPPANDDERFLRDQLDEYRSLAQKAAGGRGGRISVRYVNPDNEARRHEADGLGCTKQPLQAVNAREEQATIQEVYRCVTFEYLGRREKIEFLPPGVQGLEYELSSIIKNMTATEAQRDRTIGFVSGHGELTPEEGMQYLSQLMEQERSTYHTRSINLESDVPADIKGLIIANPVRAIPEAELRRLDAYLMRGGSIAVFAGGLTFASTDPTSATGTNSESRLNDWLDGYGIHLDGNVILDPRSTDGVIRMGRQAGRVRLVTWPVIAAVNGEPTAADLAAQGGLDPTFPAVFRLPEFITPYPSRISLNTAARTRTGGTLRTFASTGPRSILRTSDFDMSIVEILHQGRTLFDNATARGPYPVGVALEGRFHSAFEPAAPEGGAAAVGGATRAVATGDARLMVLGSGSVFALDTLRIMAQLAGGSRPGNLTLLFNTFDWLSGDKDLMAIRAKDTSDPSIRADVTDTAKMVFKWGSIVVLPLGIGILGLAITSARRSRRKSYTKDFGIAT